MKPSFTCEVSSLCPAGGGLRPSSGSGSAPRTPDLFGRDPSVTDAPLPILTKGQRREEGGERAREREGERGEEEEERIHLSSVLMLG